MTDPLQSTDSEADSKDDLEHLSSESNNESFEGAFRPETLSAQLKRHRRSLAQWLTEADRPERIFWLAVAGYLFGLLILTLPAKGLLWLNDAWGIAFEGWLENAFTMLTGIKTQWVSVALIQIVLWWQIRYPKRPPLWQACMLAVAFCLATNSVEYVLPGSWQMPLPLLGYVVATTLASFAIYLFWFRTLSIFTCFWLVRQDSVGTSRTLPPQPLGWSIRGFFLVTLLAALLVTMVRIGQRVLESMDGFAMEVDFQWILVGWALLDFLITAIIATVVVWHCIRPNWRMVIGVIVAAVAIESLGQAVAQAAIDPQSGVSMFYPSVRERVFEYILSIIFHRTCFRLWRVAGFELISWTRGRGYQTKDGPKVDAGALS